MRLSKVLRGRLKEFQGVPEDVEDYPNNQCFEQILFVNLRDLSWLRISPTQYFAPLRSLRASALLGLQVRKVAREKRNWQNE